MEKILHATKCLHLVQRDGCVFAKRPNVSGVVCIAGTTVDNSVLLLEQFRPSINAQVIEFPAGLAGDVKGSEGEPLIKAARRELLIETGYEPTIIMEAFVGASSAGVTDEIVTFFIARGLRKVATGGSDPAEKVHMHLVPLKETYAFLEKKRQAGCVIDIRVPTCLYLLNRF